MEVTPILIGEERRETKKREEKQAALEMSNIN